MFHQQPKNDYAFTPPLQEHPERNNTGITMPKHHHQQSITDEKHLQQLQTFCNNHHYYFVGMEMNDGSQHMGIIMDTDQENVYLLMPIGNEQTDHAYESNRQYGYGPGYGGGGQYYPRRFRRFQPFFFPLLGIRRFFFPYFY